MRRAVRAPARAAAVLAALAATILAGCLVPTEPAVPGPVPLVASAHPVATAAGLRILAAGGNAVDAAAAVQFALNVAEPMMSGIGGGAFLLLYDAQTGALTALDGREVAPRAATATMFQDPQHASDLPDQERGIAVGVPGTLAVWDYALNAHGTKPLAEVLAPAIEAARDGVVVDDATVRYIQVALEKLRRWPAAAGLLLQDATCPPQPASQVIVGERLVVVPCSGGTPLPAGTLLRQPLLADTFAAIARDGTDAFYRGPIGERLVAAQASRGGVLTVEDLASYRVEHREVVLQEWRGHRVATMGLPSSGVVLQEALAILEPLDVSERGDPDHAHRAIEAMHLAFADRAAYLSDPATARATPAQLLDPAFVAARRALLDDARTGAPYPPGDLGTAPAPDRAPVADNAHTTHFTVMDAAGDIVAATSTIESVFGSGILVPEHGFFLNNEVTDFDLAPGGPNEIGPGKRPLSSMTPTIVFDDDGPVLTLGSPGGPTIPGTVLQVLLDVLAGGTPLQEAVDAPRWSARRTAELDHEPGLDPTLRSELARRGHAWREAALIGGVQALHRTDDGWVAAADPRRSGETGSV